MGQQGPQHKPPLTDEELGLGWAQAAEGGGRPSVGLGSLKGAEQLVPRRPPTKPVWGHDKRELPNMISELPVPGGMQAAAPGAGKGIGTLHRS